MSDDNGMYETPTITTWFSAYQSETALVGSPNIGAITKKEAEEFVNLVLKEFPGYKVKWTKCGGICIRKSKTVCIDERFIGKVLWQAKEHILHEFAHANTAEDCLHGEIFYAEYIRLLQLFMIKH